MSQDIYQFNATALDGTEIDFARYRGEVLLIVNTASRCGFTPQYRGLQQLHEDYAARGLRVLGFPCNQFLAQEPGEASEIQQFCELNYGVSFPLFAKIEVNGPATHPLFAHLKQSAPGVGGSQAIKWNFTKFLVDRDGQVVRRIAPATEPAEIAAEIEALLDAARRQVA